MNDIKIQLYFPNAKRKMNIDINSIYTVISLLYEVLNYSNDVFFIFEKDNKSYEINLKDLVLEFQISEFDTYKDFILSLLSKK